MAHLMQDPTFWIAVSLFTFLFFAYKPIARVLASSLDDRADKIETELAEATKLREEAQSTLALYKQKLKEVEQDALDVVEAAKQEAEKMKADAAVEMKAAIDKRIETANERIEKEEMRALQEIEQKLVAVATQSARDIVTSSMKDQADGNLIKMAIKNIDKVVH